MGDQLMERLGLGPRSVQENSDKYQEYDDHKGGVIVEVTNPQGDVGQEEDIQWVTLCYYDCVSVMWGLVTW